MSFSLDAKDIRSFVEDWNRKYPIDRWWRSKFNVPFGSQQHMSQSMLDMRVAYEEDRMYEDMRLEIKENESKSKYVPGRGDWLKKQPKFNKMTSGDVDEMFDALSADLSKLGNVASKSDESGKQTIRI